MILYLPSWCVIYLFAFGHDIRNGSLTALPVSPASFTMFLSLAPAVPANLFPIVWEIDTVRIRTTRRLT